MAVPLSSLKEKLAAKRDSQKVVHKPQRALSAPRQRVEAVKQEKSAADDEKLAQAPEIELSVLATVYQQPEEFFPILQQRGRPEFFFTPRNRDFLDLLTLFYSKNKHADPDNLLQFMVDCGKFDRLGGSVFIGELLRQPISASGFVYSLELLQDKYVQRQAQLLARNLIGRLATCSSGEGTWTILSQHEHYLRELRSKVTDKGRGVEEFAYDDLLSFDRTRDPDNLIGNRWVCKGFICLWAGASGLGKSTFEMQLAHYWAVGQPCFGIKPVRPLRSLILQQENCLGDTSEQLQDVSAGIRAAGDLKLNGEVKRMVNVYRIVGQSGDQFLNTAENLIDLHRPDLLWIDPLHAFAGCDLMAAATTGKFLREGLIPLADKTGIGVHVIHHAGKSAQDSKSKTHWTEIDYQYLGFGTSEIQNAFRAVNVIIPVPGRERVYRLILSKRGDRAGAKDIDGDRCTSVYIAHTKTGYWEQVAQPEEKTKVGRPPKASIEDILTEMGTEDWTPKAIKQHMRDAGMGERTFYNLWRELKSSEKIHVQEDGKWSKI